MKFTFEPSDTLQSDGSVKMKPVLLYIYAVCFDLKHIMKEARMFWFVVYLCVLRWQGYICLR